MTPNIATEEDIPTMQVTVYGPNLPNSLSRLGTLIVHKAGCADTLRAPYTLFGPDQGGWTITVKSVQEVVFDVFPPSNFGYDPNNDDEYGSYLSDIHFAPCTATLPD